MAQEYKESAVNPLFASGSNPIVIAEAEDALEKQQQPPPAIEYRSPSTNVLITALVSISTGLLFGFVMYQSGVALPSSMRGQVVFNREAMIKMWMGAVMSSYVLALVFSLAAPDRFTAIRKRRPWGKRGLVTTVFGAFVQGVGIAISGSACGGMTFTQMGAGVPNAYLIFLGGLLGAFVHGFVDSFLQKAQVSDFNWTLKSKGLDPGYIDLAFRVPFYRIAVGAIVLFAALIAVFESVFPWETDLLGLQGARLLGEGLLNPTAAGIIVGTLQIPMFLLLGTFIGTSSSYSVITAQWMRVPLFLLRNNPEKVQRLKQTLPSVYANVNSDAWFQIVYCLAAALGGFVSRVAYPEMQVATGVGIGYAVVGGFLNIFGARVCSGCVCGHGVSGMSILSVNGFIVTPAMWIGAVVGGFVLRVVVGDSVYYVF